MEYPNDKKVLQINKLEQLLFDQMIPSDREML
jgi:hypothetical protein